MLTKINGNFKNAITDQRNVSIYQLMSIKLTSLIFQGSEIKCWV